MRGHRKIAAACAALGFVAGAPIASAAGLTPQDAEKVRKLDMMLMVSALRCRTTADGFQSDYRDFSKQHLLSLTAASRYLEADLGRRYGAKGARKAMDRLSVSMANSYGVAHPTMSCADLKQARRELARSSDPADLTAAADRLLSENSSRVALIARP
ncbi:MAG: S-adenosyl-L-homocysteine hydrolase [Novosphingobium sp.]